MTDKNKGSRRLGRVLAVQALYPARINLEYSPANIEKIAALDVDEQECNEEAIKFAHVLMNLAEKHLEEADELVKTVLENWEWDRLCAMDKTILGVAVLELMHLPEVPARVVINEAIEIAKEFSTEKSGIFVNGILDSVARDKGLL